MTCTLTSPVLATRELAARLVPVLERVTAAVKVPVLIHNTGAPVLAHLDLLASVAGAAGFVVDERDDPSAARAAIGPGRLLLTGPDVLRLERRTPDEARAGVAALLRDRAGDPSFVLATTGADVTWRTPLECIAAVADAVRQVRA